MNGHCIRNHAHGADISRGEFHHTSSIGGETGIEGFQERILGVAARQTSSALSDQILLARLQIEHAMNVIASVLLNVIDLLSGGSNAGICDAPQEVLEHRLIDSHAMKR